MRQNNEQPMQLGFSEIDINGPEKLSLDCVLNREAIVKYYSENEGAIFYLSHSGGVDSMAAYETVKKIVPSERIVVIHATLGRYEHDGVIDFIKQNIDEKLLVVRDENYSLTDSVLRRGKWFSSMQRFCTSQFKRQPIEKAIRNDFNNRLARGENVKVAFNCTGIISAESTARAKKFPLFLNKSLTTKTRTVFDFLPVFDLTKAQIWEVIKNAQKTPHKAYGVSRGEGNDRLSCLICLFGSKKDIIRGALSHPDIYAEYIALERTIQHTLFFKTKQRTHKSTYTDLISGKVMTTKQVVKTTIKIPLEEKIGLPYNELAVKRWIKRHEQRRKQLIDEKVKKENVKAQAKLLKENAKPANKKDTRTIAMGF